MKCAHRGERGGNTPDLHGGSELEEKMISVDQNISEQLFRTYLDKHNFEYRRSYRVNGGDIDFRVNIYGDILLCDVKEVKDSTSDTYGEIDAERHIRGDIRKLRAKFSKNRPEVPVLLVTMNFSSKFFTGLTIARALLGEIGFTFDRNCGEALSPFHHLPKGNAALTHRHNRSISGVFVFDHVHLNHRIFLSPFADYPISLGLFPEVEFTQLDRRSEKDELIGLSRYRFWGID
ncbi:MAG: hypothetical protein JRI65_14625 [Deltaproteobacteria bacterium]|nr:hypothetical protein [Deltaproteobacteria bacterium]